MHLERNDTRHDGMSIIFPADFAPHLIFQTQISPTSQNSILIILAPKRPREKSVSPYVYAIFSCGNTALKDKHLTKCTGLG